MCFPLGISSFNCIGAGEEWKEKTHTHREIWSRLEFFGQLTKGEMKIENGCEEVIIILTMKIELYEKRS